MAIDLKKMRRLVLVLIKWRNSSTEWQKCYGKGQQQSHRHTKREREKENGTGGEHSRFQIPKRPCEID